jgi:hypothetical protein
MSARRRKPDKKPRGDMSREGRQNGTNAKEIAKAEEKAAILDMRVAGVSYRGIAKALGRKGHGYVHALATAAITEIFEDKAAHAKRLELERLDALWRAVYPLAVGMPEIGQDGQPGPKRPISIDAQRQCLRISARRSKMLGFDAPKVEAHLQAFTGSEQFERWTPEDMDVFARTGKLPKHERQED